MNNSKTYSFIEYSHYTLLITYYSLLIGQRKSVSIKLCLLVFVRSSALDKLFSFLFFCE